MKEGFYGNQIKAKGGGFTGKLAGHTSLVKDGNGTKR